MTETLRYAEFRWLRSAEPDVWEFERFGSCHLIPNDSSAIGFGSAVKIDDSNEDLVCAPRKLKSMMMIP
jgi:hypothetical protein